MRRCLLGVLTAVSLVAAALIALPTAALAAALPRTGWTATASATGGGDVPARMLDGNASTRWSTGVPMSSGQSVTIDMHASQTVDQITMDSAGSTTDYARGYQVFLSADGANWGGAVATGTGTAPLISVSFTARSARYIRVVQTGSTSWWWSIAEFNAYNSGPQQPPGLSANVHLFYYPWYGSPAVNGSYRHWQQGGHNPPADIGANLYPKLGAYDSGDLTRVVSQQMAWVKQSGAGVIVYSWWGQGSYEDQLAAGVLNVAAQNGIKVAWHLEPYTGRTAASTVADINYINSRYGPSPAFYRDIRHGNRPAFYVFESLRITDWTALDQVRASAIVLAQTTDTSKVAHFGGMYTYDGIAGATAPGWQNAAAYCKANGLVWAPSVAPGYIDDRANPGNTTPTLGRANGSTYDTEWSNAIATSPSWVSVTSFNEWHEGSVIEPAASNPPAGFGYETFQGAYGTTGTASETAYLDRTRYWIGRFPGA
ncbi:discoidin domain-containing protein [Planotetraspora silvatica]|uniref:discoidin domain-containing protein n=1 Tax=Planotetraspora silvatica TaxID=234614 RepID=UPI00194DC40E|nr:discoidin domain-containing protein [Planotetraspora silvatica]